MRRPFLALLPAFLMAVVLTLSGFVLTPASARPCTCTRDGIPELAEQASAVFVGSVTSAVRRPDILRYDIDVQRSYKGEVADTVELRSQAALDQCALALRANRTYMIFGTIQGDVIEVNRCGGTAPPTDGLVGQVQAVLGQGTTPTPSPGTSPGTSPSGSPTGSPGASPSSTASPGASPTGASISRVEGAEPADFTRLAAPGAAAVIVGLLGLLVLGRVGRSR